MIKYLYLFLIPFLFMACSTPKQLPKSYSFQKEKEISKNFDVVWAKIIQWFGEHDIPVRTIEKASGLIATEYNLSAGMKSSPFCDCGIAGDEPGFTLKIERIRGNFNLTVVKINDNTTKVKINTFYKADYNA